MELEWELMNSVQIKRFWISLSIRVCTSFLVHDLMKKKKLKIVVSSLFVVVSIVINSMKDGSKNRKTLNIHLAFVNATILPFLLGVMVNYMQTTKVVIDFHGKKKSKTGKKTK